MTAMHLEHVLHRLLQGSSYPFEQQVREQINSYGRTEPPVSALAALQIEAAELVVLDTYQAQTEWHVARGIEAMHYIEWAWKKALTLAGGEQVAA